MEAAATVAVEDGQHATTALKGTRIEACRVIGRHENHGMDASEPRRLNRGYM